MDNQTGHGADRAELEFQRADRRSSLEHLGQVVACCSNIGLLVLHRSGSGQEALFWFFAVFVGYLLIRMAVGREIRESRSAETPVRHETENAPKVAEQKTSP